MLVDVGCRFKSSALSTEIGYSSSFVNGIITERERERVAGPCVTEAVGRRLPTMALIASQVIWTESNWGGFSPRLRSLLPIFILRTAPHSLIILSSMLYSLNT